MTVSGNPVYCLLTGNYHAIIFPFLICKLCMYPMDDIFYLCVPLREILRMFHHIPGTGHRVYLCLTPLSHVFKKWSPFIILDRIFFKPVQYFTGSCLISGRIAFV